MKTKIYYILLIILTQSCVNKDSYIQQIGTIKYQEKMIQEFNFSAVMENLVDSFIVAMKPYKDKRLNGINLIGLIKILESSENNSFKICLEGISNETLLKEFNVDEYFIKDSIYFCFDYNLSYLLNKKERDVTKVIIKNSKIEKYNAIDIRFPCWLIEIKKGVITRINRHANSLFGPKTNKVGYFTEKGVIDYELNEWGEILDKNGKVLDTIR